MPLYIVLFSLFCLVLVLTAVEQRKASRERKKLQHELNRLRDLWIHHGLNKEKQIVERIGDPKPNDLTSERLNTILPGSYEEYLKNGGTDDPLTWLYGTTSDKLFP